MKLIVCVDDRGGMMFGGRRLSRDRVLTENMLEFISGEMLFISPYSESLFDNKDAVTVCENPLNREGFIFLEDQKPDSLDCAETLVIYKWNRLYPSDTVFDFDLFDFELKESMDFAGSSHEKITREVYIRK